MAPSGPRRRWWLVALAVAGVVAVFVVAQLVLAVEELWEGLAEVAEAPAAPSRPVEAAATAKGPRRVPGALTPPLPIQPPGGLAGIAPPRAVDTDGVHDLALRRAARERWRASQTPEELAARKQRQEARKSTMAPDEAAMREEHRVWKRKVFGDTDEAP